MGMLVDHAWNELNRIEEDSKVIAGFISIVRAFERMEHSGMSAMIAARMVDDLLMCRNLSPLTDDPDEWNEVGTGLWQSSRNAEAFSNDEGKTYTLNSEKNQNPVPVYETQKKVVDNG